MASRSDNLPRRFARIYTAAIADVMDELGLQRQTLPWAIQPLTADMRLAGYAFTARWRPRDWGQPLTIGGVRVALGDIVVGDWDGVVVVPRRVAHEVLVRCERLVGTENRVRAAVRRGITPLEAYEKFGSF